MAITSTAKADQPQPERPDPHRCGAERLPLEVQRRPQRQGGQVDHRAAHHADQGMPECLDDADGAHLGGTAAQQPHDRQPARPAQRPHPGRGRAQHHEWRDEHRPRQHRQQHVDARIVGLEAVRWMTVVVDEDHDPCGDRQGERLHDGVRHDGQHGEHPARITGRTPTAGARHERGDPDK
ncbi:hypothetical protein LJ112_02480 [Propionibacterium freudenreichii]|uniref:hypothetical protein n=2 Tax=Propionibacterium freudenreichii TaxID=1744 RepID=UPI0011087915|nr:hypothetical protein [Propionibacterium freudenreichii]MDK9298869.1 hypothetical protein [Propionibacterium freudenreichii]MDK9350805.1 hypothetical protein [Propionibacterium freudenreichii]MDK9625856.1 hypothetical protein [Propionibacterium freudenreichii]MDK9672911.1 hypothetical protein [Propionibacterium freudenreichii]WBF64473.1 hypothetical protein LJ112_02480 [Propionibacterium freudenreichii]